MIRASIFAFLLVGISIAAISETSQLQLWTMVGVGLGVFGMLGGFHKISSHVFPKPEWKCGGDWGVVFAFTLLFGIALSHAGLSFPSGTSAGIRIAAVATTETQIAETEYANGHFRAASLVNGQPVEMLVDTGASVVMLRHEDAQMVGIVIDSLEFDQPVLTANGRSYMALANLAELSVQGVYVKDVQAAVAMPGQLHTSLLGMNFLSALDEVVIKKDRMIFTN